MTAEQALVLVLAGPWWGVAQVAAVSLLVALAVLLAALVLAAWRARPTREEL